MTLEERNTILTSTSFIAQIRIALCDWLGYWAINGTDSIENETLRSQTEAVIRDAIDNLDNYVGKIAVIAITDPAIKSAEGEVTDVTIQSAVASVMANALTYLM